jgi:hypothetical protein
MLRAYISLHSLLCLGSEVEADDDPSQRPKLLGDLLAQEEQSDYRPNSKHGKEALDYHAFRKQLPKGSHLVTSLWDVGLFEPVNQNPRARADARINTALKAQ